LSERNQFKLIPHTAIDVIEGRQRDHDQSKELNHKSILIAVLSMALHFNQS
jgi:hypothetical protein